MFWQKQWFRKVIGFSVLVLPLAFYGWRISLRPPLTEIKQEIIPAIVYQRRTFQVPRPYIVHLVEIDLSEPNLKPIITKPFNSIDTRALTTSQFVRQNQLVLAVNGSFFAPFQERTPWNYRPKTGDLTKALGEQISNGRRYSWATKTWRVLCFDQTNQAQILDQDSCPEATVQGIAGKEILVKDGKSVVDYDSPAYSRNAVGTNKKGDRLWLILVDGKQPFYSEGVTQAELAQIGIDLGCDRVLNLDGGGSVTLAVRQGEQVNVLNAPIHTKIPMRERPVANHLGFKVRP